MTIPNNHLSYALTWFALAATLAAVTTVFIVKREQGDGPGHDRRPLTG